MLGNAVRDAMRRGRQLGTDLAPVGRLPVVLNVAIVVIAVGWALGSLPTTLLVVGAVTGTLALTAIVRSRAVLAATRDAPLPDARLVQGVERVLQRLDPIEHHRIDQAASLDREGCDLASPSGRWPQIWVGPAGVRVVDVCIGTSPEACTASAAARGALLVGLVEHSQAMLAGRFDDVEVRAVVVTAGGVRCADGCCPSAAEAVPPSGLTAAISRGTVLPMSTVERVCAQLAADLTDPSVGVRAPAAG